MSIGRVAYEAFAKSVCQGDDARTWDDMAPDAQAGFEAAARAAMSREMHTPPVTHIEARHWRSPSMGEEWTLTAHFREGLLGSIVAGGTSLELAQRRLSKRDAWPGPSAASYRGNPLGWLRALEALGITHSVVRVARKADLL